MITIAIISIIALGINWYVKISTNEQIIKESEYTRLSEIDCMQTGHINIHEAGAIEFTGMVYISQPT